MKHDSGWQEIWALAVLDIQKKLKVVRENRVTTEQANVLIELKLHDPYMLSIGTMDALPQQMWWII